MKKLVGSILCTAVLAASVGSVMLPVSAVENTGKNVNVVSLGDSIARAHGCEKEEAYGYLLTEKLKTDLKDSGSVLDYVNYGKDGATSTDLLDALQYSDDVIDSVKTADLITISIGGNNLIQGLYKELALALDLDVSSPTFMEDLINTFKTTSPFVLINKLGPLVPSEADPDIKAGTENPQQRMRAIADAYQKDMYDIFKELKSLNSDATIMLTTVPNPTKEEPAAPICEYYLQMYNRYINDIEEDNVLIADCDTAFKEYTGSNALTFTVINMTDFSKINVDPHPTPAGHQVMADTHYAKLGDFIAAMEKAAKETTTTAATTTTTAATTTAATTTTTAAVTTATTPATTTMVTTDASTTKAEPSNTTTSEIDENVATTTKNDNTESPKTGNAPIAVGSVVLMAAAAGILMLTKKSK